MPKTNFPGCRFSGEDASFQSNLIEISWFSGQDLEIRDDYTEIMSEVAGDWYTAGKRGDLRSRV